MSIDIKIENENELFEKYKELFVHKDNIRISLMGFGFAVGDGWYDLVRLCCEKIKNAVDQHNEKYDTFHNRVKGTTNEKHWHNPPKNKVEYPQVAQVKEKFGGLRFYTNGCDAEIYESIQGALDFAESMSFTICEDCGNKGKLREDRPWIKTLCDKCYEVKNID